MAEHFTVKTQIKAGKLVTDLVEGVAKATGLDKLADNYTQTTGKDCGCAKRKAIMDKLFPI